MIQLNEEDRGQNFITVKTYENEYQTNFKTLLTET